MIEIYAPRSNCNAGEMGKIEVAKHAMLTSWVSKEVEKTLPSLKTARRLVHSVLPSISAFGVEGTISFQQKKGPPCFRRPVLASIQHLQNSESGVRP